MPDFLPNPIILILVLSTTLLAILYVREYSLRKKTSSNEKILENTQQKAYQLLYSAIKKAQSILSLAELEGIKVVAASKTSSGKLDQQYIQKLESSIQASQQTISAEVNQAQQNIIRSEQEFLKFLNDLKSLSEKTQTATLGQTQQRINQLFERLESRLSEFLISTEQKTISSIELEIKSTRALIETYRSQRLKLIDENIIAILERTLSLLLAKKLSLKDQLDLVYEALEKAKVEKFII